MMDIDRFWAVAEAGKPSHCALRSPAPACQTKLSATPRSPLLYGTTSHGPREEIIMFSKAFAAVITALVLITPAFADDPTPDTEGGRYTFNKTADGFVRLDTRTGEVSLCGPRTVGWTCQAAPEDRAVLENEIARLRGENAALKQAILSRGLPLPPGAMPEPPAAPDGDITLRLPDNADIDRAMAFVGRVWQRLVEAIARAQKQVLNNG
jgi:hypothetical protein